MKQELVLTEKSIPKSFKQWYLKMFSEAHANQTIDVVHEYDRSLTIEENKQIFMEKFKSMADGEKIQLYGLEQLPKKDVEYIIEEREQKELLEQQEKTEKEYQHILEQIKTTPTPNINKITKHLREFIKLVLSKDTEKHTILIVGKQGRGKSYTIKSVLKEFFTAEQLTKIIKNGYTTPLTYYNLLYDNQEGAFFFDDLEGIYNNKIGISLLKQTTDTEKSRLVCYSSTTGRLEHRNTSFFFKGNQILCMNTIPRSKEFLPILSRIRPIIFNPTYKEILVMCYEIIKEKWLDIPLKEKIEIVEFLERNTSEATENFDLRLLNDFIDLYRYCEGINDKFREMSKCLIETNIMKEKILELSKTTLPIEKQYQEIKELMSRATFYNLRNEMGLARNYGV